jgi:hypothetical protein
MEDNKKGFKLRFEPKEIKIGTNESYTVVGYFFNPNLDSTNVKIQIFAVPEQLTEKNVFDIAQALRNNKKDGIINAGEYSEDQKIAWKILPDIIEPYSNELLHDKIVEIGKVLDLDYTTFENVDSVAYFMQEVENKVKITKSRMLMRESYVQIKLIFNAHTAILTLHEHETDNIITVTIRKSNNELKLFRKIEKTVNN